MKSSSTPPMGVNTTDVVAMNTKFLLAVSVISSSLLLIKQRRKIVASSPRTSLVLLPNGLEGRAVRLRDRNKLTVLNWIPGAEYREQVGKGGKVSNQRIMLPINGGKAVRAAYFDDFIVKTEKGFIVVKFDKTEQELFFVDTNATAVATKRAFKRWVSSLG